MRSVNELAKARLRLQSTLAAYDTSNLYSPMEQRIQWEETRIEALRELNEVESEINEYAKGAKS